ncbi:MAG: IclR family transcriptional regulator [Caldilineales bacterium]|nr:IclR family transcriptional regulator [Caldilineales bacterium]MCX7853392.1 IclR family transcriptional regulator [Caldilineales bacterium]
MSRRATGSIQVIDRAVAIMKCFSEQTPELSVSDLSRRLGLHKSTVSRILASLEHNGLVGQNPETGKYRLGLGLIGLAGVALGRLSVRGAAQPYLPALVSLSQETVNVVVRDGAECVNIEREASPKAIQYVGWIGRRMPMHCTAAGKVLLAAMSPAERAAILPNPLPRYTANTLTDPVRLAAELERIAAQGYATDEEEFEEGFSAIAAPIRDHRGEVVAALVISGPTFRLNREVMATLREPLLETANRIASDLGYTGAVAR